jgi:hypothetical protein
MLRTPVTDHRRGTVVTVTAPAPDELIAQRPCGTVLDTADGTWGAATASFNTERTHRFRLSRRWGDRHPRVNFVMLNPSTADAFVLDPTVRRCVGYAQRWGMGSIEVTNLFALRSTDPHGLYLAADPVGSGNDDAILAAATVADLVIVAWGNHGKLNDRTTVVREMLTAAGVELHHLGLTKLAEPAHPLYLPGSLTPQRW